MVEFTSTTPSTAGNTEEGYINSFSSQLDAATLAAVGDPAAQQGGIEKLTSDDLKKRYTDIAQYLVSKLPTLINLTQAECLARCYYPDYVNSENFIIPEMQANGVLVATSGGAGSYLNFNQIPGIQLAYALWNAGGMKNSSPITAAQFDTSTDNLFGDIGGVSPQTAAFLTSAFGTNGTLSLDQVAAIFDSNSILLGVAKEIGDYVNVTVTFDAVPTRSDIPTIAAFLMCYDQNNDGLLSSQELRSNNQERRLNFVTGEDPVPTFMACYGKKDSSGTMVLDMDAVKAMLTDGSLSLSANADSWGTPFATNLKAIPIERVISGATYGDAGSLNDGILSNSELVTLFGKLGQNVTTKQAQFLINVYGDGTSMTTADVQEMRVDGFLTTGSFVSDKATLSWDNIDGGLISDALCRAVGVAAGTGLTADQFDTATDTLFGDTAGVNAQQAAFLTRIFGTDSTLNSAQIAGIFEQNIVSINGVGGESYVRIAVKTSNYNPLFSDNATAANYIAMFDTDYDGSLNAAELQAAINSRTTDGQSADDKITQTYMNCYGDKNSDGTMAISRDGVMALLADNALQLVPVAPNRGFAIGFDINLNAIPTARLLRGQSYGYVSGVLLARAIFKQVGQNPDAAGVTVTSDQFNNGFNLLYSGMQVKPLKDPVGLTEYFGFDNSLTVAQMGNALDAVNTDISIPLVSTPVAGGEGLTAMKPAFHTTSWWDSVVEFVEGAVGDVVSTISKMSGVAEDVVARLFNGAKDVAAIMVNEGSKVIPAIVALVKAGDEDAKNLIGKFGTALTKIPGLSDKDKEFINRMTSDAQGGLDDTVTATLCSLVSLEAGAAFKAITDTVERSNLQEYAQNMTFDDLTSMFPDFNAAAAYLTKKMDELIAALPTDTATLQKLAAEGFTLDSNNNLIKDGVIMSLDDSKGVFEKFLRVDIGFEMNFGVRAGVLPGGGAVINGGLVSSFLAFKGWTNGRPQLEVRFRVIDEAGIGTKAIWGAADTGLITVHDVIIPFSLEKNWVGGIKQDVLWNSALGGVLEGSLTAGLPGFNLLAKIGGIPGGVPEVPANAPVTPPSFVNKLSFEMGAGWGMSVTYNLTKLNQNAENVFMSEIIGASGGLALTQLALGTAFVLTEGEVGVLELYYGATALNVGMMVGSFVGDIVAANMIADKGEAKIETGFFAFGAVRGDLVQYDDTIFSLGFRARLQFNWSNDPWGIM